MKREETCTKMYSSDKTPQKLRNHVKNASTQKKSMNGRCTTMTVRNCGEVQKALCFASVINTQASRRFAFAVFIFQLLVTCTVLYDKNSTNTKQLNYKANFPCKYSDFIIYKNTDDQKLKS